MSVELVTLGCRLNTSESETMREQAAAAGLDDVVIVNTCAVTAEAVRQARQAIRRTRRERPDARIVVTGCAAQIEPETFAAMTEVDLVLGNDAKLEAASWGAIAAFGIDASEKVKVNDIFSVRETAGHLIAGFEARTRAFVQVQNGCDHRCTFCVIPYGRGASRSVPAGVAVEQIRRLADGGYREVVLTGVDITSWGHDLPGTPRLGRLVGAILREVPGVERLRISSIDQIETDPELIDLIASEPRLMPHLHLSLQSGDDMILKRMKRRHSRDDALRFCTDMRARRPDLVFGADLIAGFPTETEAMFQNTIDLVADCGLTFTHVFPFSPRPGTPAARMPQVARAEVKDRAARLRAVGEAALAAHLDSRIGAVEQVLIEKDDVGHTEQFAAIRVAAGGVSNLPPGDVVAARVIGRDGTVLIAEATTPGQSKDRA
ncbi:tRNA (N(6)-L-threonylcarbamoyladenosine(37)-C(2))-methylthiotransferase MtaB [Siculibacillus lacustris]|uniref:tRNA (N(6)-L-threonylcarbamoyladenosine(37)-C(2))-methylthiotransferase MtaB n=1 Tax=Siculibacillus lacustris TaxID=1549641 RepID=A0A4Q9VL96_9HYPH|nr:tRNA (N(6)-L-threonylcarbamoyladenosine(37)-C(2))-methylthiotransferase MtaB [Siculibacillus lacustris]TBW36143.1 tRNA (N(6)-L-threonylcarbamoyladenosine(37)-C(2))-methylthiotransferase MtaB [Siculibacillus lacustris]